MSLFLPLSALQQRKRDLQNPAAIGGLAGSLQRELHSALDVPVPDGKSRLTRNGGRCAACTVLLTFNPRSPYAHTCPTCGIVYTDQVHHEWWLMNSHLWTAEQCTRAAALAYLLDDEVAARRADQILEAYTERYLSWSNRDNALGPTRPFFSTYLESIWLLHLVTAIDLRIASVGRGDARVQATLDRVVAPSARLIAGFDEGRSNRQVWHAAALLAAGGLLNDESLRANAAESLRRLIRDGLHTDGSWYEGENYHLFAHRGLLSGVTLAERAGIELPSDLLQRFELGFAVPFRTMLPDGTFPARRDSQYGVALRQYRTADWVECGFARNDTPELRAALATLYAAWPERGETHRSSSSADAERNMPGVRLTRADCSWRALLLARLELPMLRDAVPQSELLEGQGLAVFRRNGGKFWVGLDYGDPGAGHGHPDRLNLVIATQESRWLDDVGTGSYTSPTLAWYRSSMAHNAPMVNGLDQGEARGTLLAHDEQGETGWVSAEFIDSVSGVRFVRTVVVMHDHVLDEIQWESERYVTVDIPMQALIVGSKPSNFAPFDPETSQRSWLSDCEALTLVQNSRAGLVLQPLLSPTLKARASVSDAFTCLLWTGSEALLWRARTIGPPAGNPHGMCALRQHGTHGRSVRLFASPIAMSDMYVDPSGESIQTTFRSNEVSVHRRSDAGWDIVHTGSLNSMTVSLHGIRSVVVAVLPTNAPPPPTPVRFQQHSVFLARLGESHYRPTEESWTEAGAPTAEISLRRDLRNDDHLQLSARVNLGREPHFTPLTAENPLDNELADVNSDGVQLHWRSAHPAAWNSVIAVPDESGVRLTATEGSADGVVARWEAHDGGYTVIFTVPLLNVSDAFAFDVVVNECPPTRERRRGQLVLSGAHGEFAYLRGARQSPDRALHVVFDPTPL